MRGPDDIEDNGEGEDDDDDELVKEDDEKDNDDELEDDDCEEGKNHIGVGNELIHRREIVAAAWVL